MSVNERMNKRDAILMDWEDTSKRDRGGNKCFICRAGVASDVVVNSADKTDDSISHSVLERFYGFSSHETKNSEFTSLRWSGINL